MAHAPKPLIQLLGDDPIATSVNRVTSFLSDAFKWTKEVLVKPFPDVFGPDCDLDDDFSFDDFAFAKWILETREFQINNIPESMWRIVEGPEASSEQMRKWSFLVPGMDLVNHHPMGQVRHPILHIDAASKNNEVPSTIRMVCGSDINPGCEVFASYGPLTRWELLRYYGFIPSVPSFVMKEQEDVEQGSQKVTDFVEVRTSIATVWTGHSPELEAKLDAIITEKMAREGLFSSHYLASPDGNSKGLSSHQVGRSLAALLTQGAIFDVSAPICGDDLTKWRKVIDSAPLNCNGNEDQFGKEVFDDHIQERLSATESMLQKLQPGDKFDRRYPDWVPRLRSYLESLLRLWAGHLA